MSWLIITGTVRTTNSMRVTDKRHVAVLGDVRSRGLAVVESQLFVGGTAYVPGVLLMDSSNGGFTHLRLLEPAGLIATQSNAFDVDLSAKYYYDPIFSCGFGNPPTSPHEEVIASRIAVSAPPTQITLKDLVDYFTQLGADSIANNLRIGGYQTELERFLMPWDSCDLVNFLDQRYANKAE